MSFLYLLLSKYIISLIKPMSSILKKMLKFALLYKIYSPTVRDITVSYSFVPKVAPKGAMESPASLKHCLPKGIPIMVMHQITPKMRNPRARPSPPKIIQITLAMGCAPKFLFTTVPKGQKISLAILNACLPKGIPIMVIHQKIPMKNHMRPSNKPVKRSHKMLPIVFILYHFLFLFL